MKKIEAYIRHESFEPIRMELLSLGFPSLSISEVKGSGRQKGITERYRGAELTNWLRPKVKLECVVARRRAGRWSTPSSARRTGQIGDGKVFVMPVEEA
jgi:nitrogen regulatory protein P-II 1